MKIEEIKNPKDKIKYSELANEIGNIFNSLKWLKIFENKTKLFGIYENGGKLVGGFCLYEERKLGLKIYQNPPFTPCIGPILQMRAQNPVTIMDRWKEAMSLMAGTIDGLPYSVISISLNKNVIDAQPFIWRKFKTIPGYTYILVLEDSVKDIQERMSKEGEMI